MKLRIQGNNFSEEKVAKLEIIKRKYHFAEHIHQYAELAIPLKGQITLSSRDREEILSVGEAALVFPFQPHKYKSLEYNELALFVFSPSLFPDVFNNATVKKSKNMVFTPLKSSLSTIVNSVIEEHKLELLNLKGALYLLISDYLRTAEPQDDDLEDYRHSVKIIKYIKAHISEKISLNDMSAALGYSPSYISSLVKSFFGDNLAALISALRIEASIGLLLRTKKSCLEISEECGFGCERNFFKQFKEIVGATPKKYRMAARPFSDYAYDGIVKIFD